MNIEKNEGWQNNYFNERIYKEFPRKFSIEDIDGIIRFEYVENDVWKTRLIIIEIKRFDEKEIGQAQLKTLSTLYKAIDWNKFDDKSGVFLIKAIDDNTWGKTEITQIFDKNRTKLIGKVDFSYYKGWFYNEKIIKLKCIHNGCESENIFLVDSISGLYECKKCCNQFYL